MKVWSINQAGRDGKLYSVRYLLTLEELAGLQAAGLIGDVDEVIGMQEAADSVVAMFERDAAVACGGATQ